MGNQNLNKSTAKPQMRDAMDVLKREISLGTNCHAIGKITSYDPVKMTVDATIAYSMVFQKRDPGSGVTSQIQKPYPPMAGLPVIIVGGGPVYFDQPIAAGDECIIMFNDRDLMNWYAGQPVGPAATTRLHSFSDGVALVGLRNVTRPLVSPDGTRGGITDGKAYVGVNPQTSLIVMKNAQFNLNTLLQNLLTQIETIATSVAVPGVPIAPGVVAQVQLIGNQLMELLE